MGWFDCAARLAGVLTWAHGQLGGPVRALLWRDRRGDVEAAAQRVGEAFADGRVKDAHGALRRIREVCPGSKKRRAPASAGLLLEDGSAACSYGEMRLRWLQFFAEQENAVVMTPADLVGRYWDHVRRGRQGVVQGQLDRELIFSLTEVEQGFRRAKRGRATGLDCLPDDILAALPEEMARIWHPLLAKVTARIQEPLSFKGGRFAELFKGNGDQRRREADRSIFLSNGVAKQYHRLLRGRLLPFLEA